MTRLISRSAPASAATHVVPHLCLFNTRPSVGQASFSSMVRRPAMYAIRKKGTHYHQGWVAKNPNISICFVKSMQRSNFATGPTTLNPGLTKEDNNQHIQSSFSDLTNSSGNVDQTNQLSTSGFNDWESANAQIRGSSPTDGSKQFTSYGKMNDITVSPRKSWLFQCSGNTKKSWVQRMDEWKNDVNFSKRNALLVESAIVLPDAEDALSDTLKDLHSSENFILSTSNIDLVAPQESKTIFPDVERALSGTLKDPHSSKTSFLSTPNLNPVAPQAENEINVEITEQTSNVKEVDAHCEEIKKGLSKIYDKVLVVDNVTTAKQIVTVLTTKYKDLIHACDTEVSKIDVKQETPVNHGEIICFSIYSGPQADFGNGKAYIWVDVLDGGHDVLIEFAPFFEDPTIKKVWHNYSFDSHIIGNCGIQVSGFHADTMHLARLWDSSRKIDGGYSLEALSNDPKVMSQIGFNEVNGKISMKAIFGRRKLKKDGSPGKSIMIDPVELLQRTERIPWISYSVLDSISTLRLYESLKAKLEAKKWNFDGRHRGSMYNFYEEYWRPFGSLLVKMEAEGLLVDRAYLSDVEKVAISEQQVAADRFRSWASKYCPDAKYMNVGSDLQIRQLFFGGTFNRKDDSQKLPNSNVFKVPNVENVIEDGKKKPSKYRNITLHNVITDGEEPLLKAEMYTDSGWPSTSGDALKILAGKILPDCIYPNDGSKSEMEPKQKKSLTNESGFSQVSKETSIYGTAFDAFGGGKEGKEACHAIAALCEVCSIDSLISNFILPLQGTHISGKDGRIHCSLNINTETGRLSARRPNLQNQPALEKDRYKIRQAFIAGPGKSLIVADYGQLELRILAHLANCKSMLDAFKAGGDFHSRTAMNMYAHVREAVENNTVLLEWHPSSGEEKPPVPLLKDAFAAERRKAKMLNFSIAYGKTPHGLSRDWKVSLKEARETVQLWYKERKEVLMWQQERKKDVTCSQCVHTLLGRTRHFPLLVNASYAYKNHVERAAINTPVQGSAADVAMCAMLEIDRNEQLRELGWKLLLQVHDEVILEGPTESSEVAKEIVIKCMENPFSGRNILKVDLAVDAKCSQNWYAAK